jgi:hypothetical protein
MYQTSDVIGCKVLERTKRDPVIPRARCCARSVVWFSLVFKVNQMKEFCLVFLKNEVVDDISILFRWGFFSSGDSSKICLVYR